MTAIEENRMNVATQTDGEPIAKDAAEYAEALTKLQKRRGPYTWWTVGFQIAMGLPYVLGIARQPPEDSTMAFLHTIVTTIPFFLVIGTAAELVRVRRQFDALVVLVTKSSHSFNRSTAKNAEQS